MGPRLPRNLQCGVAKRLLVDHPCHRSLSSTHPSMYTDQLLYSRTKRVLHNPDYSITRETTPTKSSSSLSKSNSCHRARTNTIRSITPIASRIFANPINAVLESSSNVSRMLHPPLASSDGKLVILRLLS